MPVIGPEFVFLCVPRTGSNMMARAFLPQFGGKIVEPYHARIVVPEHAHKFRFAIVRNPYDRMLSCWYHIRRNSQDPRFRQMGLMDFVNECHIWSGWVNQAEFLELAHLDVVLKFEQLSEEIHRLPFVPTSARLPSERINSEERPPWLEDLTPEFIGAVNELCAPVFPRFGYERL